MKYPRLSGRRWLRLSVPILVLGGVTASVAGAALHATPKPVKPTYTTPAGKPIKSFVWDLPDGEPTSLDQVKAGAYPEIMVLGNICDSLMKQNPDFSFTPNLASSVKHPNPTTWVYNIRKGVTFWDGNPLTADDVAFSLQRNAAPSSDNSSDFKYLKSISVTGANQVTLKLTKPYNLINKNLSTVDGQIVEKAYVTEKGSAYGTPDALPMCTGPFEITSWQQGSQIVLQRNPHYWNPAAQAKAAQVTLKFVTDTSTLVSALKSGAIDGSYEIPISAVSSLDNLSVGKLHYGPSLQYYAIIPIAPQLKNPLIRRALSLAIDRKTLVKTLFGGMATPAYTLIPPAVWGSNRRVQRLAAKAAASLQSDNAYNIAKAKALVRQAGSPKTPIVIGTRAGNQFYLELGQYIQAAAKSIGLNVQVKALTPTQFGNIFYSKAGRSRYGGVMEPFYFTVADPRYDLDLFACPTSFFNFVGYKNKLVCNQVQKADNAVKDSDAVQHILTAEKQYTKDQIVIPLADPYEISFMNKRLSGETTSFAYLSEAWAASIGAAH
jgi:ABC-type transport system substrate-binding protein